MRDEDNQPVTTLVLDQQEVKIPSKLISLSGSRQWQKITVGESGAKTFYLPGSAGPACYLKVAPDTAVDPIWDEYKKLIWLQGRLPVPQVLYYSQESGYQWLLTSAIPGLMAFDPILGRDMPRLLDALGKSLRLIHNTGIESCPFDSRLETKIKEAGRRVAAGLVAPEEFDTSNRERTPQSLLFEIQTNRPTSEDLVFTHGDFCLPNILFTPDYHLSGFVDWGRAGVADRYQDLALCVRSLEYNFGTGYDNLFLEAYGLDKPDQSKLQFYQLLDELF